MKLTRIGSAWGGCTLDYSIMKDSPLVISAGLAYDLSIDVTLIKDKNARVIGIDPTKTAINAVKEQKKESKKFAENFVLLEYAIADKSGESVFLGGPAMSMYSSCGEECETLAFRDILKAYKEQTIDFIKMDIELAEYLAIPQMQKEDAPIQMTVGFHHWINGPTDHFPDKNTKHNYSWKDTQNCIRHLSEKLDMELVHTENDDPRRIIQEALFIRRDVLQNYHTRLTEKYLLHD